MYSLKEMNGVQVLVGPDGRWFPLNGNSNMNNNMNGHHATDSGDGGYDDNRNNPSTTRGEDLLTAGTNTNSTINVLV